MPYDRLDPAIFQRSALEGLLLGLSAVPTGQNLLVLDRRLFPLINYLTPFSAVKTHGRVETTINLDELVAKLDSEAALLEPYKGLVIVMDGACGDWLDRLPALLSKLSTKPTTIIVRNLTKSLLFQANEICGFGLSFEEVIDAPLVVEATLFLTLRGWPTHALSMEEGFFSLARPDLLGSAYLQNPLREASLLAEAMVDIASRWSLNFQNHFAKGDNACLLLNTFEKKLEDYTKSLSDIEVYELEKVGTPADVVVLERSLDLISVFLTPMTYGGLVREVLEPEAFGVISTTRLEGETAFETITLDDSLYAKTKNLNFSSIGYTLKKTAQSLQGEFDSRHAASTLNEIQTFVSSLGGLTAKQGDLKKHTALSECIIRAYDTGSSLPQCLSGSAYDSSLFFQNDIFEMGYRAGVVALTALIARGHYQLFEVVRFLAVFSHLHSAQNGFRLQDYQALKSDLLQSYGLYPTLFLLQRLEHHQLLRVQQDGHGSLLLPFRLNAIIPESTTPLASNQALGAGVPVTTAPLKDFGALALAMNLLPPPLEGFNPETVDDFRTYPNQSFFFPGNYVPIMSRLVEALYLRAFMVNRPLNNLYKRPNWIGLELAKLLGGAEIDRALKTEDQYLVSKKPSASAPLREEVVFVVVMGGVTYSELVALRYVEARMNEKLFRKMKIRKRLVVLTASGFLKGNDLLEQLVL